MPVYTYICNNCSNFTEASHSMDEKLERCPHCDSCDHLAKKPSSVMIMKAKEELKEKYRDSGVVPGELVKQTIEDTKKDMGAEKEMLKNRVWAPPNKK
jgi:putative FmdB family regulatory protein